MPLVPSFFDGVLIALCNMIAVGRIGICCMPFAILHKGLGEVSILWAILLRCTKIDESFLHFPDVFLILDVPQGNASHEFLCFQSSSSLLVLLLLAVMRLESFIFFF